MAQLEEERETRTFELDGRTFAVVSSDDYDLAEWQAVFVAFDARPLAFQLGLQQLDARYWQHFLGVCLDRAGVASDDPARGMLGKVKLVPLLKHIGVLDDDDAAPVEDDARPPDESSPPDGSQTNASGSDGNLTSDTAALS